MIADLNPYPAYKESGLPWLKTVPAQWDVRRMKFLFRERVQKNFPNEPLLAATQTKGVVRKEDYGARTVTAQKDFELLKLVETGDFVISLRSFQGGIEVAHYRGIISPAYTILKPIHEPSRGYFSHLFKSVRFIQSLTLFVTGIREGQNIDYERLSRAYLPVPPPDEQAAIVRFLDYATGRVERAIRAKRKLIALLNEQKQTIIHRAVTRGLDPNAPLRNSGVDWIGEIPAHWEVHPLKHLLSRMDYGTSEGLRREGKVRVLTMSHIKNGEVTPPNNGSLNAVPPGLLLRENDLLFNRTNSPELVGKVGIFRGQAEDNITFASYLVRLRTRAEHNPNWLNYLLNSSVFWAYARSQALVSLHQANLNSTRYGQMALPVTGRLEQDEITDWILSQTATINAAIDRTEREIKLLQEYRIRLIADVVTGQLDVREAAQHLPAEEETPPTVADEELADDEEIDELVTAEADDE